MHANYCALHFEDVQLEVSKSRVYPRREFHQGAAKPETFKEPLINRGNSSFHLTLWKTVHPLEQALRQTS